MHNNTVFDNCLPQSEQLLPLKEDFILFDVVSFFSVRDPFIIYKMNIVPPRGLVHSAPALGRLMALLETLGVLFKP